MVVLQSDNERVAKIMPEVVSAAPLFPGLLSNNQNNNNVAATGPIASMTVVHDKVAELFDGLDNVLV